MLRSAGTPGLRAALRQVALRAKGPLLRSLKVAGRGLQHQLDLCHPDSPRSQAGQVDRYYDQRASAERDHSEGADRFARQLRVGVE